MRRVPAVVLLLFALAISQCRGRSPSEGAAGTPGASGQHLLVRLKGALSYKQPGWSEYQPLSFGVALERGDLIQVSPDGEGLLVCSDLSLATLRGGYRGGLPCSDKASILMRGESLVIAPQRGGVLAGEAPFILSPRRSFVRDRFPLLTWQATSSGGPYRVRVWGGDVEWSDQVTTTEVRYPQDAPALQPGISYRVSVTDSAGRSSDEEQTPLDLSFALLPAEQVAAVEAQVGQAHALGLEDRPTRMLDADVYASHELRADAISTLDQLTGAGDTPALDQRLGDLYREIGLYEKARDAYDRALAGFRVVGDRAGQANVLLGLGLAQRGDQEAGAARESLGQAQELYRTLGDAARAAQVAKVLEALGGD